MDYDDGYAAADDVVGHELTHGLTENESNLFNYYQSGAINESFSDVWGEFIDLTNTSGTDTATTRWLLGEDVPGGAIRDMEDPTTKFDPDRMLSSYYTADFDEVDGGGVHINSGVNNKAAYLMTDGGTFNGKTVTGLGITKVAKIYYEAQTNLLTSASDYQDLHSNLRQACTNLIGTSGITATDCSEVKDAVDATEMNLIPPAAQNPEAPVCPTGQTATDLFNDNLENPASGNWTKTGSWFYPQNPNGIMDAIYATSGTTNIWGYNQGSTGDYAIARAADVTPPTGKTKYLRFNHAYGFGHDTLTGEAYDGGVLEYSTNGGSSWQDAGSLFTNNDYNGTISSSFGNPLGGRSAFVRESNGYISSRMNLSSLAGQNIRFRFRIGTDDSFFGNYGWFIDDVRVYTCEGEDTTAPTAKAPTHKFTTLSTLGTSTVPVKLTWSATDNPGGSGIASYQLQQSINGGAYTDVTLPSATATTISRSLDPGTNTYRYRVVAKDNAGNLSAWAAGPSFKVTAYQESSSAIVDTGSWTTSLLSSAYGGSVQSASALGRNATFSVPAGSKNVEWVSYRGNRGKAQVWLDGVQQDANPTLTGIQPFDLYSSSVQARKVVFSKAVSPTTSHKLEVGVLGKKNASSTSTRVDIDAFVTTS